MREGALKLLIRPAVYNGCLPKIKIRRRYPLRRATLSCILIFWCVTLGVAQDKGNQWLGTWKLDTAKSKLQQSPKEETLQVDAAAKDNIKWSLNGTAADGSNYSENFEGKADGKPYAINRD